MKNALIISLILILAVCIFSVLRFGLTLSGFLYGDGLSVLTATSSLIGIWALVVSFSITAIVATFQLSKLPNPWKLRLLKTHISKKIIPFIILALIAGVIPFTTFLSIDTTVSIYNSTATAWLILCFILQILLIFSATKAALTTYEELTLIPAIKTSLKNINIAKLEKLMDLHKEAFNQDYEENQRIAIMPMTGFSRSLNNEGLEYHEELVTPFINLFREHDPQILDIGIRIISEWLQDKPIKDLDNYFQYRIIPPCFHLLRTEDTSKYPLIFKTRLYYFAKLINAIQKNGATLTGANAANPLWEAINEYANHAGIVNALELSELAISELLQFDRKNNITFSILLQNLLKSIIPLITSNNNNGLNWIEKIILWYRIHFESTYIKNWTKTKSVPSIYFDSFVYIYKEIEEYYGDKPALCLGDIDVRYWTLVTIRRLQEEFVDGVKSTSLDGARKEDAKLTFDLFENTIQELLEIRRPIGDEASYKNLKYNVNPYK